MDIFLLLYSPLYPELQRLEDRATRRLALDRAISNRVTWAALVFGSSVPALAMFIFVRPNTPLVVWSVLFLGAAWASIYMAFWLTRRWSRRKLWKVLCDLDLPTCAHCGYDLRGQTEPRCPECGAGFDKSLLRVAAEQLDTEES